MSQNVSCTRTKGERDLLKIQPTFRPGVRVERSDESRIREGGELGCFAFALYCATAISFLFDVELAVGRNSKDMTGEVGKHFSCSLLLFPSWKVPLSLF